MIKVLLSFLLFFQTLNAQELTINSPEPKNLNSLQKVLLQTVDSIEQIFKSQYAMTNWKRRHLSWDFNGELNKVRNKVINNEYTEYKQFRRALADLIQSTKDYHVGISFLSTETASLPLDIRSGLDKSGVKKYFIARIDRDRLSQAAFPYQVGDEIKAFNGRPVADLIEELKPYDAQGNSWTAHSLSELFLTRRSAARAQKVPQGAVLLKIYSQRTKVEKNFQLVWSYTEEKIDFLTGNLPDLQEPNFSFKKVAFSPTELAKNTSQPKINHSSSISMLSPYTDIAKLNDTDVTAKKENPWMIGARKSYVPELGTKLFETTDDNQFHAYTFKTAENKIIGFIRIPGYIVTDYDKAIEDLKALITKFEMQTDALVIDQINNGGGSVFYLYAIASLLSDSALVTPKHRMQITQSDLMQSLEILDATKLITDDATAQAVLGKTWSGYPSTKLTSDFLTNFGQFVLKEWKEGRTLTKGHHVFGVDHINPYPKTMGATHYSKPILLMINNLDFSGGDFFPAIMQDNKRATIFGATTAGAGGYVKEVSFPNLLGISKINLTASYVERIDGNPIENLGVTPDVKYELTEKDFQTGLYGYKEAILKAVNSLIK